MASFIKKNRLFLFLVLAFGLFCLYQVAFFPKGNLVLYFNKRYNPIADVFFKYYTHVGDGLFFCFASILVLLLVKIRWGLIGLLTFAVSGILTQVLKKIVFGPLPRPLKYFEGTENIAGVEGFKNAYIHSFPSGHSTTVFAMFALVAFVHHKKPGGAIACFVAAVLAAISRIYLAQHFAEDVMAGTLLGTLYALVMYYWLEEKQPGFFKSDRINKPLLKLKA